LPIGAVVPDVEVEGTGAFLQVPLMLKLKRLELFFDIGLGIP
jgi:hypothetical protein